MEKLNNSQDVYRKHVIFPIWSFKIIYFKSCLLNKKRQKVSIVYDALETGDYKEKYATITTFNRNYLQPKTRNTKAN